MTENERLKVIRLHLGLTQRLFSNSLKIKQGSYSDVERGKAGISALLLKNLIKTYRVNPLWLCEGEGEMFIEDEKTPKREKTIVNKTTISKDEEPPADETLNIDLLYQQQQCIKNAKAVLDFLKD